jgi:hypothetical protein
MLRYAANGVINKTANGYHLPNNRMHAAFSKGAFSRAAVQTTLVLTAKYEWARTSRNPAI